jgi:ABC-type tungstate transport system substrate-binding protein
MAATARWGVRGAIASYFGVAVAMAGVALVSVAYSDGGLGSLEVGSSSFEKVWDVITLSLRFYVSQLWILPLSGTAIGFVIYWFRMRRLRA